MVLSRKLAEWIAIALFAGIVALVFQQIATSMTEQGIASGSPYDNAAAYPKAVAILIAVLIAVQAATITLRGFPQDDDTPAAEGKGKAALFIAIFAAYLFGLSLLGYHIATVLMIAFVMYAGGMRSPLALVLFPVGLSLAVSYFFEALLNIVLPGGVFALVIPW